MGAGFGLLLTNAPSCLYQMSPPEYRQLMIGLLTLIAAPFNLLGFTLGIFDTGTRYFWRIHFLILFVLLTLDILAMVFLLMNKDSIEYTLKNYERKDAAANLSTIYHDTTVEKILDDLQEIDDSK